MKKIFVFGILILTMCVGCSNSKEENISLYQRGIDLINEIDYIAENQEILELVFLDEESLQLCEKIGSYDYSESKTVYEIENILDATFKYAEVGANKKIPQEARDIMRERTLGAFPSIINAQNGIDTMNVASILSKGNAFKNNMTGNTKTYLYIFDESEYKFIVTFFNHGNGVVSAEANIIINDEFNKLRKNEDFEKFLNKGGLANIHLVEVN